MIWLAIRVLQGVCGARIRFLATAAARNPLVAVSAALALLCALLWHGWAVEQRKANRLGQQVSQIRDAEAKATALATAALIKQESDYRQKAKETDDAYQSKLADADARARAYITAHRVDGMRKNDPLGAGSTAPSSANNGPGSGNRSGEDTNMVAVTPGDIDICTENTRRLLAVHDWASTLGR